jgi:hypothetical protein
MKAPEKFRITLTGTTFDIIRASTTGTNVGFYMANLVMGQDVPLGEFERWFLRVAIEEAPEVVDGVSIHAVARDGGYVEITCDHCGRVAVYAAGPLSELCRSRLLMPSDIRLLGRSLRCDARQGGCGKKGATVRLAGLKPAA